MKQKTGIRLHTETAGGANETGISVDILTKINKELRAFLEHSLTTESFWEKWTAVDFGFRKITCWKIKNCERNDCPSFQDADCRCWLRAGTLCGGDIQGDFAKKYRSCFECDVLKMLDADPVRSLYENINILIHHLGKRDEKIMSMAIRDQLTGVYNRTYFNEYIEKMIAYSNRYGEYISFIMIDLDGFKPLNDKHGHQAGDAVLVETARIIQANIRNSDMLFRYGGDEFLIVLPHSDCEKVEAVKIRLQDAAEEWNNNNALYDHFTLSLSIGCATWQQGSDLFLKIKEADNMMYIEKRQKTGLQER
ncbi:MAG: GGDEF domain-containing protein [Nitrospiraceae bacterium]|nr:GGDEF domain-containing protein [Nitrospiraceae bacterium]